MISLGLFSNTEIGKLYMGGISYDILIFLESKDV